MQENFWVEQLQCHLMKVTEILIKMQYFCKAENLTGTTNLSTSVFSVYFHSGTIQSASSMCNWHKVEKPHILFKNSLLRYKLQS
jgi:hypothetical protein